jgi:RHS repeat-associated protein
MSGWLIDKVVGFIRYNFFSSFKEAGMSQFGSKNSSNFIFKIVLFIVIVSLAYSNNKNDLNHITSIIYRDIQGNQEQITYDNRDNNKRKLTSIEDSRSVTNYSYDSDGKIIKIEKVINNHTFVREFNYDYDGKLLAQTLPSNKELFYTYNENGELSSIVLDGITIIENTPVNQQRLISLNYSDSSYYTKEYDLAERVKSISNILSISSNSKINTITKDTNHIYRYDAKKYGDITYFVYDGDQLIGEYDQNGNAILEYIYYNDKLVALIKNDEVYKIHGAYLHTILKLHFLEQHFDKDTNNHNNVNRNYTHSISQYIQNNPLMFEKGINLYLYKSTNSVTYSDSSELPKIRGPIDILYAGYFTGAYFFGNGVVFDLNEHLDLGTRFYNAVSVQNAINSFTNRINSINCSSYENKSIFDTTVTDVTTEEGLFAVGHSKFFREANCIDGQWKFHFYIRDLFSKPLMIGSIHLYDGELPGGTPYPIIWDYYK